MRLALAVILLAAQDRPPIVLQKDVDEAIQAGGQWLLHQVKQGLPGDVPINTGKGLTVHGFVLYTLHHAGVDMKDPAVVKLIDTVARQVPSRTYTAAANALALSAVDPGKHCEAIARCAQYLADTQCRNGQWGYGEFIDIKLPELPVASGEGGQPTGAVTYKVKRNVDSTVEAGDNSNTQYAALGLWACSRAGAKFDQGILDRAIKWWESSQQEDGGWGYDEGGKHDKNHGTFGSMTAGAAGSLAILKKLRGRSPLSGAVKKGIDWLESNWAVEVNPSSPPDREMFNYYYLYALERLGDVAAVEKMGKRFWYAEGADFLLKQRTAGCWTGKSPALQLADTCFAILFLDRSMAVKTTSAFDKPGEK